MTERKRHRVLIGATARDEFRESLEQRSRARARSILEQVDTCIGRLATFPESAAIDARASFVSKGQPDAAGRAAHVAGFTIRYAFPIRRGKDATVLLILSIRDDRRRPLDDPEYMRRFLVEISKGRKGPGTVTRAPGKRAVRRTPIGPQRS